MTETVAVALITATTGLVGTAIGSLFAYLTAKATRKSEFEKHRYTERINAYQGFSNACTEYLKHSEDAERYADFLLSTRKVYLVASDKTYFLASAVAYLLQTSKPGVELSKEYKQKNHELLMSFREDLSAYKGE